MSRLRIHSEQAIRRKYCELRGICIGVLGMIPLGFGRTHRRHITNVSSKAVYINVYHHQLANQASCSRSESGIAVHTRSSPKIATSRSIRGVICHETCPDEFSHFAVAPSSAQHSCQQSECCLLITALPTHPSSSSSCQRKRKGAISPTYPRTQYAVPGSSS